MEDDGLHDLSGNYCAHITSLRISQWGDLVNKNISLLLSKVYVIHL